MTDQLPEVTLRPEQEARVGLLDWDVNVRPLEAARLIVHLQDRVEVLEQQISDYGLNNLDDRDEYDRCRSLDDKQIVREAMETPIRMVHELGNRYDVVCEKLDKLSEPPVECHCIEVAPRNFNFCQDCGGRIQKRCTCGVHEWQRDAVELRDSRGGLHYADRPCTAETTEGGRDAG